VAEVEVIKVVEVVVAVAVVQTTTTILLLIMSLQSPVLEELVETESGGTVVMAEETAETE
jgi:hypothetical protein